MKRHALLLLVIFMPVCLRSQGSTPNNDSGSVGGVVIDAEGHPLAGATVYAFAGTRRQVRTVAGADGRFLLEGVPVGDNYVDAYKESAGYPYAFFAFFKTFASNTPVRVTVRSSQESDDIKVELGARSIPLVITVINKRGAPVVASGVSFDRQDMPGPFMTSFPPGGTMLVPMVPFKVTVSAPGYRDWSYRWDWKDKSRFDPRTSKEVRLTAQLEDK